ncbi:MAG: DUF1015 domain-containing protein [bacterium]
MAQISPFKGILYNQEKIQDLSLVVTPPYDVISEIQQERYYQKHPYNCIRLILGKDLPEDNEKNNKYTRAADYFHQWLYAEILKQDLTETIYPLIQRFSFHNKNITRAGFITLMRLEEFGNSVFPHEKTLSKPKQDRLNLMLATKANFCQVFGLYSDEKGILDEYLKVKEEPIVEIMDENEVSHQLVRLKDKTKIEEIKAIMQSKPIFIADGHHRYETALNAQKILGYNFIMIYLTKMEDEGLTILPTHRLVKINTHPSFSPFFEVEKVNTCNELLEKMEMMKESHYVFGMYAEGKNYLLILKDNEIMDKLIGDEKPEEYKKLDVSILQTVVINHILKITDIEAHIGYTHNEKEAILLVDEGKYNLAFFLNPTRISQLKEMSLKHELMPQKSTYFYPKLLTGLVMNKFR